MLIYPSQSVPTYITPTEENGAVLAFLQLKEGGTHQTFEKLVTVVLLLSLLQNNSFRLAP